MVNGTDNRKILNIVNKSKNFTKLSRRFINNPQQKVSVYTYSSRKFK